MPFQLPTIEQTRDAILRDWRNLDASVAIDADSDNHIRATGIASSITGLYQFASWGVNQFFPDTADEENLVRFAAARGIVQQPAVGASGTVQFQGVAGSAIPLATVVQTSDGKQYQTTAPGAIAVGGTAQVQAAAIIAGPDGNLPDNTPGVLQTAPAGVEAAATFLQMGGGVNAESLASLLTRVLDRLRQPPAGGNQYDYPRWAMEVPGVTAAFMYPTRRGIGTADVAILSNGLPPTETLRAAVAAYIEALQPVTTDCMVLSPQLVAVDVTATLVLRPDADLATVRATASTNLAAYFATLRPGDTARRSRIQTVLGDIDGVLDYELTAPAANVATVVDATRVQMPALGVITIGP